MAPRRPFSLRWIEEAEARRQCEWAAFDAGPLALSESYRRSNCRRYETYAVRRVYHPVFTFIEDDSAFAGGCHGQPRGQATHS
jgi:hypothetical protein